MFVTDVMDARVGDEITLVGYVGNIRKFSSHYSVRVRDITGSIFVKFQRSQHGGAILQNVSPDRPLRSGARIRVIAVVAVNGDGTRLLDPVVACDVLGSVDDRLADLDADMQEQASRMLMSRVSNYAAQYLRSQNFVDFDARVISTQWLDEGLEPLWVVYPGFGSPVPLATSPAAQVVDFMTITGAPRAFTISTSFSTTYRFPNGSAEARVIVGKAMDLDGVEHIALLHNIAVWILERMHRRASQGQPGPLVDVGQQRSLRSDGFVEGHPDLRLETRGSLPVENLSAWQAQVESVTQILNLEGSPLVEGSRERFGDHITISGFTIYPSQFLELLQKTPGRQLRDLRRFRVWEA